MLLKTSVALEFDADRKSSRLVNWSCTIIAFISAENLFDKIHFQTQNYSLRNVANWNAFKYNIFGLHAVHSLCAEMNDSQHRIPHLLCQLTRNSFICIPKTKLTLTQLNIRFPLCNSQETMLNDGTKRELFEQLKSVREGVCSKARTYLKAENKVLSAFHDIWS